MIFLSAQPDSLSFAWQTLVQNENFKQKGINPKSIYNLVGYTKVINNRDIWDKLDSNVIFYEDTRESKTYVSSIRPHIIKKFFKENQHLIKEYCFYYDSDIIFNELPLFEGMQDGRIHLSDTDVYIGYTYLQTKISEIQNDLFNSIGADAKGVEQIKKTKAGGAQYFFNNLDWTFWDEAETYCENMWKDYHSKLDYYKEKWLIKKPDEKFDFQIWTVDMWVLFWLMLKRNRQTYINDELSFSWGTWSKNDYLNHNIFHNAGVTDDSIFFYKGKYINKTPFEEDLKINPNHAQFDYVNLIKETGKKFGYKIKNNKTYNFISYVLITDDFDSCFNHYRDLYYKKDNDKELIIYNIGEPRKIVNQDGIRLINNKTNLSTRQPYENLEQVKKDIVNFVNGNEIHYSVVCAMLQ